MAQAMNVLLQAAIVQGHRAGVIADANELRDQQPLWMDYSGISTGFDDIGRWGY
jgi:hypothetical protein